jgi:nitroreductase / dihydropteridine reductase
MQQSFISQLKWRFATKKFDASKQIPSEDLEKISDAIRLAPTSFGIQPFHVYDVASSETRSLLREAAFGQPQVTEASHLFVFAARTDIQERINSYIDIMSDNDIARKKSLDPLKKTIENFVHAKDISVIPHWATHQTYIALGFALAACAELNIDSCPMEGFMPDQFAQILGLPEHIKPVALLALGYRSEEPSFPKTRFPKEELFSKK